MPIKNLGVRKHFIVIKRVIWKLTTSFCHRTLILSSMADKSFISRMRCGITVKDINRLKRIDFT